MLTNAYLKPIVFSIILLSLFCAGKKDDIGERMNEELFIQVYCDVVEKSDLLQPANRKAFADSVLQTHGSNMDIFDNTVEYYKQNPEKWKSLFEKIVAELEQRQKDPGTLLPGEQPFNDN